MRKMSVISFPHEPSEMFAKSIFLAGPAPRSLEDANWRKEALKILEELGYDGVVFDPLPENPDDWSIYTDRQISWEKRYLDMADVLVFWIPRVKEKMPGLTTNVEYGMYLESGKVLLGFPQTADSMHYLAWHGTRTKTPIFHDVYEILRAAVTRVGTGAERAGGEREAPLHIWNTKQFQLWYLAQKKAGNRLDGADVLWTFRVGPERETVFSFAMQVQVYITAEERSKTNEFIISRSDVSSIVAYAKKDSVLDSEVVIVREFRSPASVGDCFIREVPGGSSGNEEDDSLVTAAHELAEETGFSVDARRLTWLGTRQMVGTFSTHQGHVFGCPVTPEEIEMFRGKAGIAHGVAEETERTYVEIYTVRELLKKPLTDWANLGMILATLLTE
jgi:8-oxo-dGTP pyrophosphatase MutT (NUDIX family)